MSFLDGWEDPPPIPSGGLFRLAPGVKPRDYGLRYYQQDGKEAAEEALRRVRSALVVMATGLGKSRLLAAIAGDWPGDVLVLAHRDELIRQNAATLEQTTGEMVEIEQGDLRASPRARLVMGSIASFSQQRCERMGKDRFSLIVVDEAHHACAASYRRVLDYFDAKVLGVTATPDRADEKALGQVFDEVAYVREILEGIQQGYLVPLRGRSEEITGVDISGVETRQGDLVASQLDEVMVRNVEGIVKATTTLYPDRKGPAFFPGIKSAELAALRFNQVRPGSAAFLHAKTPEDERREIVRDIKEGRLQYLCNVGIATEGFDWPAADIVIDGFPTKSRSLYAQRCGRGTRVLPGIVDKLPGKVQASMRRAAIAASAKKECVLLDFVGNAGKHQLMGPEDLLGGNYTEAEVALAKKKKLTSNGNTMAALEAARAELRAIAGRVKSRVSHSGRDFDPFELVGLDRDKVMEIGQRWGYKPATEKQRAALLKFGVAEQDLQGLSLTAAGKMMDAFGKRIEKGLASFRQIQRLRREGLLVADDVLFRNASAVIDYIQKQPRSWDAGRANDLLHARRVDE